MLVRLARAELADYTGVSEELIEEFEENLIIPDYDSALLMYYYLDIEVDWGWLRFITEIANF